MALKFTPICLSLPYKLGTVNCYLVETGTGFILIDTGGSNQRAEVERALKRAGCTPGTLRLIVLTHGDFDHTGNAAYLRTTFGSHIAMHAGDVGMIKRGTMFINRKKGRVLLGIIARMFFRLGKSNRCAPDSVVDDGDDFSEFGFHAKVLSLPGHSKGSIGILTADGDLFCGDLLENIKRPSLGSLIDDEKEARASVEKLKETKILTVYPGHGTPFPMRSLPS